MRIRLVSLRFGVALLVALLGVAANASARVAPPHRSKVKITSVTATPASLTAAGGAVQIQVDVRHASKCRFTTVDALAGLPATRRCASGRASLTVVVPANTGTTTRSFEVLVKAKHGSAAGSEQQVTFPEYARASAGSSSGNAAPQITLQPSPDTVVSGQDATFTAAASGVPAPSVQWQNSTDGGASWQNVEVPGATSTTLTFATNSSNNGIELRAVFTNVAGSATTNVVTLTLAAAPTITGQPAGQVVASGADATFTAAASGVPAPAVQWQYSANGGVSWLTVTGATAATYQVLAGSGNAGYEYRALFTNIAGSTPTDPATLTLATKPLITSSPGPQTKDAPFDATFSAGASGDPTPTVQWQYSANGGGGWGDISGATSTTLQVLAGAQENGYLYRAVFTNIAGFTISSDASLTVPAESYPSQAGYFAYALPLGTATFDEVKASWTVPSVTCPSGAYTWAVQWPGIGWNGTVVQDGTQELCDYGTADYSAWYEMVGDPYVNGGAPVSVSGTIHSGDVISASVSIAGGDWTLYMDDTTSKTLLLDLSEPNTTPTGLNQGSAEVIVEGPAVCGSPPCAPGLADFAGTNFTAAQAKLSGGLLEPLGDFDPIALDMTNSPTDFGSTTGYTLRAVPTALTPGNGFTVNWDAN